MAGLSLECQPGLGIQGDARQRGATEQSMGCDAVQKTESQGFLGPGVSLVPGRSCGDELGQVRDGWGRACPVHWECGCRSTQSPLPGLPQVPFCGLNTMRFQHPSLRAQALSLLSPEGRGLEPGSCGEVPRGAVGPSGGRPFLLAPAILAEALFVNSGELRHSGTHSPAKARSPLWPRLGMTWQGGWCWVEAGRGDRQGRGAGDKGEGEARRVEELSLAPESILRRFPPKSHSCQGSDRCCD